MFRGDRAVDNQFLPAEDLYYRISFAGPIGSRPEGIDIRLPEDSVNRGKYSEAADVLYPNYFHLGVAVFPVSAVPGPRPFKDQQGDTRVYALTVEHDPEDDNYAHSEVRSYREGVRVEHSGKIPKVLKSEFRQLIAEAMVICIAVPANPSAR
jgi:hypothetical protein